jgi:hypothetical protein
MPCACRPHMPLISLALPSLFHLVIEHLCTPLSTPAPSLRKETHTSGRTRRAHARPVPCQARGDRAPTQPWTRQDVTVPSRPRPPLPLSSRMLAHHHTSTRLDNLVSSRKPRSRRHDQSIATPVLPSLGPPLYASDPHPPCHHAH